MFYTFGRKTGPQNTLDSTVQRPPLTFQNRRTYTQKCFLEANEIHLLYISLRLHLLTFVFENVSQHTQSSHKSQLFASVCYYYNFFQKSFMCLTPPVLSWSFSLTFALSLPCSLSSGGFEHQIIQQSVFLSGRFRKQKCAKNHKDDVQSHLSSCS